jgi:hypothetical protein
MYQNEPEIDLLLRKKLSRGQTGATKSPLAFSNELDKVE